MPHWFTGALTALCIASLATACSTAVGNNFDLAKADQLTPGVTTYEEAVAQLGKPTSIQKSRDGRALVIWSFVQANTFSGSNKAVGVVFSPRGVMERVATRTDVRTPDPGSR